MKSAKIKLDVDKLRKELEKAGFLLEHTMSVSIQNDGLKFSQANFVPFIKSTKETKDAHGQHEFKPRFKRAADDIPVKVSKRPKPK